MQLIDDGLALPALTWASASPFPTIGYPDMAEAHGEYLDEPISVITSDKRLSAEEYETLKRRWEEASRMSGMAVLMAGCGFRRMATRYISVSHWGMHPSAS